MKKSFQIRPAELLAPYVDRLWGWESLGDAPLALPTLLEVPPRVVFYDIVAASGK